MKFKFFLLAAMLLQFAGNATANDLRTKQNFDFNWLFSLSDNPAYADSSWVGSWQLVHLPHDWNIEMNFDAKGDGGAAYLPESVGWYRKDFIVPASSKNKKVMVMFDGIFHQSDVYVNGHHLGYRPYGFCSIYYDMTPYLNFGGVNVIAVRANCTGGRPRWYAGSGIYRHAWLITTQPVHVATYGTAVTTSDVTERQATIHITTTIANECATNRLVSVSHRIINAAGETVANIQKEEKGIQAMQHANISQSITISHPQLWSTDTPCLYTMETTVKSQGRKTDVYKTTFGIRTVSFDKDKGFSINGQPVKLKGLCLHQDNGSLGTAVPDRAYERKLEILKAYGCNAIRCAHNQPSPEFLDMCDRMGFLVIDEAFDKWRSGYYAKYFDEWWQQDMRDMLQRDRNHPCIILWSIGNELQEAWNEDDEGVKRATMLRDFVHQEEPSRLTVLAAQNNHQDRFASVTDVIGYNYLEARAISDHQKHPERRMLITEELPYYRGEEGNIRAYSTNNPWNAIAENDFIAGGFIWSGVDYLGEAGWPSKGWPCGLFDICMNEKPRAAFLRAMWNDEPMVRIAVRDQSLDIDNGRDLWQWPRMAARWNFPQSYVGMIMEVNTITNCESVRLICNGKQMGEMQTRDFPNHTIVWNVPYTPGKIEAVGCNAGKEVARYEIKTSGNTTQATMTVDRDTIEWDGQDLSFITIQLKDKDGNSVSTDDRRVTVNVKGEGRMLGLDNGDLRRSNSFAGNSLNTYMGKALITVQSIRKPGARKPGMINVSVQIEGIDTVCDVPIVCSPIKSKYRHRDR